MTGLDPDVRFDKHKAGIQANRYVQRFGLRLLPDLYEMYNPMPYDAARDMKWSWPSICASRGAQSGRLDCVQKHSVSRFRSGPAFRAA